MISRSVADSALVTFVQHLQLSQEQKEELMGLLREKFLVTSIKKIDLILDRIEENLAPGEDKREEVIDIDNREEPEL